MSDIRPFARPLRFDFNINPSALIMHMGPLAFDETARCIIAHLASESADPDGGWVHYSRRNAWYAQNRRYLHEAQTYLTVTRAVAALEKGGWIDHVKSERGQRGTESRMRASRRLLLILPAAPEFRQDTTGAEVLILKSREKTVEKDGRNWIEPAKPIPYDDTDKTRIMRGNVLAINEALASIDIKHEEIGLIRPGMLIPRLGKASPGPAIMGMKRKFTETFDLHGRFYAWWQNLPGKERLKLLIDGEPVIEEDYRQIHPTLLYGLRGIRLSDGFDAYTIESLPKELRPLVKTAFNAMVNAQCRRGLHFTIRDKARDLIKAGNIPAGYDTVAAASHIMDCVAKHHQRIEEAFFSDAGLKLMRIDSDMAEDVMLDLLRAGIVSLSIHDSFITQARHEGRLKEAMARAKDIALARIGGQNIVELRPRRENRSWTAQEQPKSLPRKEN